jgi:hypothetical protein
MKRSTAVIALVMAVGLVVTAGVALAQQRRVGDHLVYNVQSTGQAGRNGAGRNMTTTLNLAIDRVDADGTAHAVTSLQYSQVPQAQGLTFEATISPAGAILPKYDPNFRPKVGVTGMSNEDMMKMASNNAALEMQTELAPFNAFAEAAAQRTLRVGDTWQVPGHAPEPIDLICTVTGRQMQQGHASMVIGMQGVPNSGASVTGQAYYDPSARLVIGFHYELKSLTSAQSLISDISLQP